MPFQSASSMLDASVIICAHNPRTDYFARVLDSLRNQTLAPDKWELLVVDNASKVPLASSWDISWHPTARHLVESELGLSPARLRGIREASADLIVFVDDDNVLDQQYLSEAVRIKKEWPLLGVWGSGSINADFEVKPPDNLEKFLPSLALRDVAGPRWANVASCVDAIPWGAGLCIRKEMAETYYKFCERSRIQITDRRGNSLSSSGDREISLVCCSNGLGIGIFPELKLKHLISHHRVSEDYMVRLGEGIMLSNLLLDYKWLNISPRTPFDLDGILSILKTLLLRRGIDRRMRFAEVRAALKAREIIRTDLRKNPGSISDTLVDARPAAAAIHAMQRDQR
jgi:glycosyltransferase involved in cell wall biosynthesis